MLDIVVLLFGCACALFSEIPFHDEPSGRKRGRPILNDRDPVILIPGLGGSRLEYANSSNSKFQTLWINATKLTSYHQWIQDMSVNFDPDAETYSSQPGLTVRPADYGGVGGCDYLEPNFSSVSGYYSTLIDAMKQSGYVVGKDLYGAPFDWRLANVRQILNNGMCASLKQLVELAYNNNNRKVHIVGHSMGCSFTYQFLTKYVTSTWREKYIASIILTSPPLGGSVEALAHLSSPHKWGSLPIPASIIHPLAVNLGAIHWMLPNKNAYNESYELMTIKVDDQVASLNVNNMSYAFSSTNRTKYEKAVNMTQAYVNHFEPPRVPVHIIYSYNVSTLHHLAYTSTKKENWWEKDADKVYGDGDGTVPIESLRAAEKWIGQQPEPIKKDAIPNYSHVAILHRDEYVDLVLADVARNK